MFLAPRAFFVGLYRAFANPKSLLLLYLANLLVSALVTVPIYKLADRALAHTPQTGSFLLEYDAEFIADATRVHQPTLDATAATVRVATIVAFFLNIFLLGGVIATLADARRPVNFTTFFSACGHHLWPFVRVMIPAGLMILLLTLLNERAGEGISWLFDDFYGRAASAEMLGSVLIGKTLFFALLFGLLVKVPVLFARIGCVIDDDREMLRAYVRGVGLTLRNPVTITLFLGLLASTVGIVLGGHDLVLRTIDMTEAWQPLARFEWRFNPSIEPTTLLIGLEQLFVLGQQVITLTLVAGLLFIFRELSEPPPEADPELVYARAPSVDTPAARSHRRDAVHGIAILFAGALFGFHAVAQGEEAPPTPPGRQNNAYKISVALERKTMTLVGDAEVTFRNLSSDAVETLPFHLYPNAFSNTRTEWVRDGHEEKAIEERGARDGGYMEVRSVRTASGEDLAGETTIDETVMRVTLPTPLEPDEEIVLQIAFRTRLPRILARMGKLGEHINAMQWFPKLAAHRNGRFIDWPFRNPSEFHADFGSYDVSITLPSDFVVEATGNRSTEEADSGSGMTTSRFVAENVHDFAWCANPHFSRRVERTHRGTELILLNQPFLEPKGQLTLDATRFAMETLDEWLFPYPYDRLVIDVVPHGQGGGMEYPGLFTVSAPTPEFLSPVRARSESPARVAVHEFVHQYFYGLIATNEFEEAWLDEGLTTYVTYRLMEEFYHKPGTGRGLPLLAATNVYIPFMNRGGGPLTKLFGYDQSPFRPDSSTLFGFNFPEPTLQGLVTNRFANRKDSYAPFATVSPLRTRSWEIYRDDSDQNAYRSIAYSKPALMLRTIERHVGWERMLPLLRDWARTNAYHHPTSDDFVALADDLLDGEFHDFLIACIDGSDCVDWGVTAIRSTEKKGPIGYLPQSAPGEPIGENFPPTDSSHGTLALVRSWIDQIKRSSDETPVVADEPLEPPTFESSVRVRNFGRLQIPVELELRFADGSSRRVQLDGKRDWYDVPVDESSTRLVAAEVDPDRKIALDLDVTNNARSTTPDRASARAVASFYQFWVQTWLSSIAWLS